MPRRELKRLRGAPRGWRCDGLPVPSVSRPRKGEGFEIVYVDETVASLPISSSVERIASRQRLIALKQNSLTVENAQDKPGFWGISAVFCLIGGDGPMLPTKWRKRRDSNPRYPFRYASFQDWSHQPLGHSSSLEFSMRPARSAKDVPEPPFCMLFLIRPCSPISNCPRKCAQATGTRPTSGISTVR